MKGKPRPFEKVRDEHTRLPVVRGELKKMKIKEKVRGKHIVIGVTGSIAAYKAAELTSQLKQRGADIYVVMTKNAMEFVGPATFRAITGNPVLCEMFTPLEAKPLTGFPAENPFKTTIHIGLSEWLDILIIAPATANIIGKLAHGIADDLLTTVVLSIRKKPILIVPAMNEKMYLNKAVQDNIKLLKKRGYYIIEPETGFLACGYTGKGRLAGVDRIIKKLEGILK